MKLEKNSTHRCHAREIATGKVGDLAVDWLPGEGFENRYQIHIRDDSHAYTLEMSQNEAEQIAARLTELTAKYARHEGTQ